MYLRVQDDIVRRNIEIFKIIVKRASHVSENVPTEKQSQQFKAFIHRIKGEIRFADLSSEPLDSKDWVVASFQISLPKTSNESISFEISGTEGLLFSWDGFYPEALSILKETIKTIQLMAKFLPHLKSLSATFREFSQINLDSFLDEIPTKDLIHESWRQISREDCEYLLALQTPGTFLFRQDLFAAILEDQLMKSHKESIKCITLTYVGSSQKISDLTFVKKKDGWVIYNDDPSLDGTMYPSARALLDSLRASLKRPLLNL